MNLKDIMEAGGPAIPTGTNYGMTLRDWFAGQALIGLIAATSGIGYLMVKGQSNVSTVTVMSGMIAIGIGSFTAHYCLMRALKLADATVVVPVDFFRLPLIAVATGVITPVLAGAVEGQLRSRDSVAKCRRNRRG